MFIRLYIKLITCRSTQVYRETPSFVCAGIKTKATPMLMMQSGAEQRPLARRPVERRHNIAAIAAGAIRCFVQELMPCRLIKTAVEPGFNADSS